MNTRLHIQTEVRDSKTILKDRFFTPPLKLANVTEERREEVLKLVMMSSSPGIMDGDAYEIKIRLGKGSALLLQTQSYQRLFSMKTGASQQMEVVMDRNSSFTFLPHPTVPHRGSLFKAINKIYVTGGCRLVWGEEFTCGRKQNGEVFQFSGYQNRTEIFLDGRLIVKDNLVIFPAQNGMDAIGQFEGYTHQATLVYIDESLAVDAMILEVNALLSEKEGVCAGVSALPVNGLIVRLLGYKAEQLYDCLGRINKLLTIGYVAQVK